MTGILYKVKYETTEDLVIEMQIPIAKRGPKVHGSNLRRVPRVYWLCGLMMVRWINRLCLEIQC